MTLTLYKEGKGVLVIAETARLFFMSNRHQVLLCSPYFSMFFSCFMFSKQRLYIMQTVGVSMSVKEQRRSYSVIKYSFQHPSTILISICSLNSSIQACLSCLSLGSKSRFFLYITNYVNKTNT